MTGMVWLKETSNPEAPCVITCSVARTQESLSEGFSVPDLIVLKPAREDESQS